MASKRTRPQVMRKNVVPDRLDLRDRLYQPAVTTTPPPRRNSLTFLKVRLPILNQEQTNACTGFALATVVNFLLRRRIERWRPRFLLSCSARWPGATEDTGPSLRGAMKG